MVQTFLKFDLALKAHNILTSTPHPYIIHKCMWSDEKSSHILRTYKNNELNRERGKKIVQLNEQHISESEGGLRERLKIEWKWRKYVDIKHECKTYIFRREANSHEM